MKNVGGGRVSLHYTLADFSALGTDGHDHNSQVRRLDAQLDRIPFTHLAAHHDDEFVGAQVSAALAGLTAEQVASTVIAYEPIWAI